MRKESSRRASSAHLGSQLGRSALRDAKRERLAAFLVGGLLAVGCLEARPRGEEATLDARNTTPLDAAEAEDRLVPRGRALPADTAASARVSPGTSGQGSRLSWNDLVPDVVATRDAIVARSVLFRRGRSLVPLYCYDELGRRMLRGAGCLRGAATQVRIARAQGSDKATLRERGEVCVGPTAAESMLLPTLSSSGGSDAPWMEAVVWERDPVHPFAGRVIRCWGDCAAPMDLDGDDTLDRVVSDRSGVRVRFGDGAGTELHPGGFVATARVLGVFDLDTDGLPEIVFGQELEGYWTYAVAELQQDKEFTAIAMLDCGEVG